MITSDNKLGAHLQCRTAQLCDSTFSSLDTSRNYGSCGRITAVFNTGDLDNESWIWQLDELSLSFSVLSSHLQSWISLI